MITPVRFTRLRRLSSAPKNIPNRGLPTVRHAIGVGLFSSILFAYFNAQLIGAY